MACKMEKCFLELYWNSLEARMEGRAGEGHGYGSGSGDSSCSRQTGKKLLSSRNRKGEKLFRAEKGWREVFLFSRLSRDCGIKRKEGIMLGGGSVGECRLGLWNQSQATMHFLSPFMHYNSHTSSGAKTVS